MPFEKVVGLYATEKERDEAVDRKLRKDFMIATGQRVIEKVTRRRKGKTTLYGYEVKQKTRRE